MTNRIRLIATLALAAGLALPTTAHAKTWRQTHPGRTEVNGRLANQQRRITQERREGDLTQAQAQSLRATDRSIRQQERADAAADHNHGHLTRAQLKTLNGELNANSQAIGR